MVTKKAKSKAAPTDGAQTAGKLQAAWPFPISKVRASDKDAAFLESKSFEIGEPVVGVNPDAAARIRVDQVNLYADASKNTVEQIAIEQLVESPFNPRTRFDEQGLRDLAESMKGVGVMQAILVRPVTLPGEFQIAKGSEKLQAYEIIFGHRRFRAAKLAGLATMPCIVRELADAQAAQLQAIENVQRKDLDALDEARGYQHYIQVHGVTKDQLAAEIGLSRTHVYSRLKLLNAVPTVQDALRAGEIGAEVALLVARIHTTKLQEKALAAIKSKYYQMGDGGTKSFRQIRDLLAEKFSLELKGALFDTKADDLIPLAGSCTNCSKRTGNAPEYHDLTADSDDEESGYCGYHRAPSGAETCTDPDCFDAKKKAHLAIKARELEAKGKTVITGGKARSAIGADGQVKGAYIALKDVREELAKAKKAGKGADIKTVTIQNPRDGKTKEAVAQADLIAAGVLKQKKVATSQSAGYAAQNRQYAEERKKREAKAEVDTKVNFAVLDAVRKAAAGQPLTTLALQMVAQVAFQGVEWEDRRALAKLHGFKSEHDLEKKIGQMAPDRLATLLLDCALVENVVSQGYDDPHCQPKALLEAAKHYGVDVAAIRKEVEKLPVDKKTAKLPLDEEAVDEEEALEA